MTQSTQKNFENQNKSGLSKNRPDDQSEKLIHLSSDQDFEKLREAYQSAAFNECNEILGRLDARYPDNPTLRKYREEIEIRQTVKSMERFTKKKEKRSKKTKGFRLGLFAIVSMLIVMVTFVCSYFLFDIKVSAKQLQEESIQLAELKEKVEHLLLVGKPRPAANVLEQVRTINPEYKALQELESQIYELLLLESQYQSAFGMLEEGQTQDALALFVKIEEKWPGLWDVNQQINALENLHNTKTFLEEGQAAYQQKDWESVISAYENALILDPYLNNPSVNEQLFDAYQNRIFLLLQHENIAMEEILEAEAFYRKALSLVIKDSSFADKRENLQYVTANLLETKYVNLARALFENPYQKCGSINQAVSYLNKAASINPENAELQSMLENAKLYQSGLQSFVDGNWPEAIEYFHTLSDQNPEFAHQNLQALHYEAYDALARQLNNEERYPEAFDLLLLADDLANQDSANLMKIFQVQVLLGDTLGEMADYQRAVSHYQTAIRMIQPHIDLNNIPLASQKVQEASQNSLEEDYQNAFFAFKEAISEIQANLPKHEMIIEEGICLALVASENNSTVNAIIEINNLSEIRITQESQTLTIPAVEE